MASAAALQSPASVVRTKTAQLEGHEAKVCAPGGRDQRVSGFKVDPQLENSSLLNSRFAWPREIADRQCALGAVAPILFMAVSLKAGVRWRSASCLNRVTLPD